MVLICADACFTAASVGGGLNECFGVRSGRQERSLPISIQPFNGWIVRETLIGRARFMNALRIGIRQIQQFMSFNKCIGVALCQ
jgi:hypothetical protein